MDGADVGERSRFIERVLEIAPPWDAVRVPQTVIRCGRVGGTRFVVRPANRVTNGDRHFARPKGEVLD